MIGYGSHTLMPTERNYKLHSGKRGFLACDGVLERLLVLQFRAYGLYKQ